MSEPDTRRIRVGVVGAGAFGKNHLRVIGQIPDAELVAVVDTDRGRAEEAAAQYRCQAFDSLEPLTGLVDVAIVAVPTIAHAGVGTSLLRAGIDVLVEKPIAATRAHAVELIEAAHAHERVLQIGHLERFNPAVVALQKAVTLPLFFEIHRLSLFSPRSLDVDVVLDLMIHDIDIVLTLTGAMPTEVRAAGVSILSDKVDIANVRLAFANGCIANLTASRVSTEKVRKLRLFQPNEYISLDYARQDGIVCEVTPSREVLLRDLPTRPDEPLRAELADFLACVRERRTPRVSGTEALRALEISMAVLEQIHDHGQLVRQTLAEYSQTSCP